jgi:hypothetical protein
MRSTPPESTNISTTATLLISERPNGGSTLPPFEVIDDMRAAHTELLKGYYSTGATGELLTQARAFLDRGRCTGKNLDRPEERLEAQRILDQWGTVLMKAVHEEIDATLHDFEGADLSGKPCPYVGLKPFSEDERFLFFRAGKSRKPSDGDSSTRTIPCHPRTFRQRQIVARARWGRTPVT